MSSVVYYRFRSSKTPHRLTFDGTGISVFDIKRGILLDQHLDSTADSFQLALANPDTHEPYQDDSEVLPRSTLVEVRRLPVARAGSLDSAMQYVSGSLTLNAKNAQRREDFSGGGSAQLHGQAQDMDVSDSALAYLAGGGTSSEQDMMNAMFAQQSSQWSRTQQEMATKTKVYTPRPAQSMQNAEPDKTLPPGYICHRCGQKGHWITNCPALYDRNWETKRVLRTTGIPKSMLRAASGLPPAENGEGEDDGRTYLMNADGEYVVAVADDKSWADFQARQLQQQARARRAVPEELQDPITHELMRKPKRMPCCSKIYDEQSIEQSLIQTDFKCPNCGQAEVYIDQLASDKHTKDKVKEFLASDPEKPVEGQEEQQQHDSESEASDASDGEYSPEPNSPEEEPKKPAMPMMMPFMMPFMMPMVQEEKEASDYESGDEEPIKGRIR